MAFLRVGFVNMESSDISFPCYAVVVLEVRRAFNRRIGDEAFTDIRSEKRAALLALSLQPRREDLFLGMRHLF